MKCCFSGLTRCLGTRCAETSGCLLSPPSAGSEQLACHSLIKPPSDLLSDPFYRVVEYTSPPNSSDNIPGSFNCVL